MQRKDELSLGGHVAIVTGGSAGIGRLTAERLAGSGASLVLVGRNQDRLADCASEIRADHPCAEVMTLSLDVCSESDMSSMAERTVQRFGRIDILIHSAGLLRPPGSELKRIDQTTIVDWHEVVETNLTGTFLANRAVLPRMIEQRNGDIINLSSKSGRRGLAFDGPYCASKFGVVGLTEAIAEEVKAYGVRVQSLLPGTFQTGVWSQAGPLPAPGHLPPADRVAETILFMITRPREMTLGSFVIEPAESLAETGWRGGRNLTR
jgi:3-oxoacyl-[acyl-carrier protein] reductase